MKPQKNEVSIVAEQRNILSITDEHRCDYIVTKKQTQHYISGTVTACCGAPLEGVCVKIITTDYEPIIHTLTNTHGIFTLIWDTNESVQLIFAKKGYATQQVKCFEETLHVHLRRDIISCIVCGRLLYKNRTPAMPLKVQLVNNNMNLSVFSKTDGSFLFTKVPGGKYTLIIMGNDCKQQKLYVTIPNHCTSYHIGTIWVEKINILCTVHGIITDTNGQPILNAIVVLIRCATNEPVCHTLTNENGLYFFGNVRNGCYYVEAYY